MSNPRIAVVGSLHMDLIAAADDFPAPGTSLRGSSFVMTPGGKGGNQARAFAALGAETFLITQLGDDHFGRTLRDAMKQGGVNDQLIKLAPGAPTGASTVFAAKGDYSSIIFPGAASNMTSDAVCDAVRAAGKIDALVVQLELPVELSAAAARCAKESGARVILNASPGVTGSAIEQMMHNVDVLVVNRPEAEMLLDNKIKNISDDVARLADRFRCCAVITDGKNGSAASDGSNTVIQSAFPAQVADAIGAGDAFMAAAVLEYLKGSDLTKVLQHGTAAGAVALSRKGFQPPRRDEIERMLSSVV